MGQVTGVFDQVPDDSDYPYVSIAQLDAIDWSSHTMEGVRLTTELVVVSRYGGKKEVATIAARVDNLLHQESIAVSGYTLVQSRLVASRLHTLRDGRTHQANLRVEWLLHA